MCIGHIELSIFNFNLPSLKRKRCPDLVLKRYGNPRLSRIMIIIIKKENNSIRYRRRTCTVSPSTTVLLIKTNRFFGKELNNSRIIFFRLLFTLQRLMSRFSASLDSVSNQISPVVHSQSLKVLLDRIQPHFSRVLSCRSVVPWCNRDFQCPQNFTCAYFKFHRWYLIKNEISLWQNITGWLLPLPPSVKTVLGPEWNQNHVSSLKIYTIDPE